MKKLCVCLAVFFTLFLFACAAPQFADTPDLEANQWGVLLTAHEVTGNGAKISFTLVQTDTEGDLQTGSAFTLDALQNGTWVPLEAKTEIVWTSEAWLLPKGDTVSFDVAWDFLYGTLDAGSYRIGKEVMLFRGPGDYDTDTVYATFEVAQ